MKRDRDKFIDELESRLEVLTQENARLVERGEDTMLLGIISEHIHGADNIDELLLSGLENISILKNIPFSACCRPEKDILVAVAYYFLQSNEALVSRELDFSEDVRKDIRVGNSVLMHCDYECECPVIEFETISFKADSILIIPSRSVLRNAEVFCFADSGKSEKLANVRPLLERGVEMISTRIDTLDLMGKLTELNRGLDRKIRQRTEELDRAYRVLRENERKFRGLFNEALDMIHFVDDQGRIVDANPAELESMQYAKEEYVTLKLEDIVDPAFRGETRKALACVLSGEEVRGHQTVMVTRDGSSLEVEVNAVPEYYEGRVVGGMAIIRDISDRKQMEEQFLKIRKMESIAVLAGGIAHDFNNILAAILGNISLAMQFTEPGSRANSLLSEAEKASMRARDLTRQLLTFSQGGEPVREVAPIVDIIKDSAGFVLRGTNVQCRYDFAEDLWPVAIDRGQISQVIQNLVINSRHAMPMGGEIVISCENFVHERDHLLPVEPGNYIKLSIRDQGTGIPIDHIDRIFDPYFTTKKEGSGLGLAVTHSIVVKHHGHIEVASKSGKGTVFTIYLPALNGEMKAADEEHGMEQLQGQGKILIMDDDKMIRAVACNMLAHAGFEVLAARTGEEAIQIFRRESEKGEPVDAVILDLTVPGGMGGKDAVGILHEISPYTPLIVSSGYSNDPVMANYREHGFSAAIVKPYKLRELVGTVRKVMA